MKNKYLILKITLLLIGVLTQVYFFLILKNKYLAFFAGGFGAFFILLPVTFISSLSCLYHFFIGSFLKESKMRNILAIIHIILAVSWLIFLQGLSLRMESEFNRSPQGVLLDRNTRLGELLPNTEWVESNQEIFYISNDEQFYPGALCSINVNGANRKKIIDNCQQFGWVPNSQDMFALCGDGAIYLLKDSGEKIERIYTFGTYYEEYSKTRQSVLGSGGVEWSPKGDKFAFAEKDQDTNGNGKIDWQDSENIYIFDIATKAKHKINLVRTAGFVNRYLWNKSGNPLYIKYSTRSPLMFYLCSYDLNSKEIAQLKEAQQESHSMTIEDYVGKENLFLHTQKSRLLGDAVLNSTEVESRNNIKLSIGRYETSLYIQKEGQPPRKIFEYIGSTGYDVGYSPAMCNFIWLPGDRYLILSMKGHLCILDTRTEKIGILTKGRQPAWQNYR